MVDREIIRTKIAQIQHRLRRLQEKRSAPLELFQTDEDLQDIVLRNLQNAIQGCVDLASHIVVDEGWAVPPTQAGLFQTLSDHQVITVDEAARMKGMVGFRNIVVHEYAAVDMKKVHEILTDRLRDVERFLQKVILYAGL